MSSSRLVKFGIPIVVALVAVGLGITFLASQPSQPPVTTTTKSPTVTTQTTTTLSPTTPQTTTTIQTTSPPTTITTTQTTPTQTTTTPTFQVNLRSFFNTYIQDISKRDVSAVSSKYTSASVAVWGGKAAGLGGTYRGEGNIRILYIAALGTAKTIEFKEASYKERVENNMGIIESEQEISGNSDILGSFTGKVKITLKVTVEGNRPVIIEENWDYLEFNYEKTGGATTFPQWADVKAGRPIVLEPSKNFKDLAWFLSDYFALTVYAAVAAVAVVALTASRRKR
ncbi:hypothetical protein CSUB_C0218 [Candidatus Caldarchaeum subterraneum]|uniref:Uncharacterized protein n=2 Tax=Caldiarchaeum subterraneum TaxID=311458 RepID=E6N4N6_CALS0|nr:hypothetical protein HGMM_F15E11C29 [Candidatus Caldarchaeum subterraneum]BAJ50079.1 hypothetical protein CSUB_C0218 [Candidatus Caldarchaeum subterraneum]